MDQFVTFRKRVYRHNCTVNDNEGCRIFKHKLNQPSINNFPSYLLVPATNAKFLQILDNFKSS